MFVRFVLVLVLLVARGLFACALRGTPSQAVKLVLLPLLLLFQLLFAAHGLLYFGLELPLPG